MKFGMVTCHECQTISSYFAIQEWPPALFICSKCQSVFELAGTNAQNEPIFNLYGYCQNDND